MKRRSTILLLTILIIFISTGTVFAQTYAFSLDKETVHVFWETDGTISLNYEFVFNNFSYADPIDFVDVGLPNDAYFLADISSTINNKPINHIAYSPYVADGVELGLDHNAIQPGDIGIVVVQINKVRDVLFEDSEDDEYASGVFSPTWFDSDFVSGNTDLTIIYHLPQGVLPDEPRYYQAPSGFPEEPFTGIDDQGRVIYVWNNPSANGYTQYLFGASFPKSYVPANTITTPTIWQSLGIDPDDIFEFLICAGMAAIIIGIPALAIIGQNRRKLKYLPPTISIAGHGIKRGLTAIEAAIVLEQPMDKILTMILFATVKKEAAVVEKKDPIKLTLIDPPQKLRKYETDFLAAMDKTGKTRRKALQKVMINLVRSVAKKMKGFSKRDTVKYYKSITEKAWAQVEKTETPEVRGEVYDEVMQWTMLDKKYDDRTQETFQNRPVIAPIWWPRYDPVLRSPGPKSTPSAPTMKPTPGGSGMPHLPGSDFAASVVNGVQGFSAGVVGSISDFTNGITKTTNPPPKPTSSSYRGSSGGGGGSSCACACACAGCACACAGGGR